MCDIDPAPFFVEKGVPAEVAWDHFESPLNREVDARLERLMIVGGLPRGIFNMDWSSAFR
ncbi:hypothetical protein [Paracoccus sp. ME4]|uniref:hypothetical protein n=1 Tax=Paracoccus sp. ME4 TaxID=3138066 RepID=UPI00398B7A34